MTYSNKLIFSKLFQFRYFSHISLVEGKLKYPLSRVPAVLSRCGDFFDRALDPIYAYGIRLASYILYSSKCRTDWLEEDQKAQQEVGRLVLIFAQT